MKLAYFLSVLFTIIQFNEGNILRWNNPSISGAFGSNTVNERIREGSTGTLNIHIAADSDRPFPTYRVIQSPEGMSFSIDQYHGQLTLNSGEMDYELSATAVLIIKVDDGEAVGTATCTIRLIDINDNTPRFGIKGMSVVTEDIVTGGAIVAIVSATDKDKTSPNNKVNYVLTNGNTGGDFSIDNSGAITVVRGKHLDHYRTPSYSLSIIAIDDGTFPGMLSSSVTVNICVGKCPIPTTSTTTKKPVTTIPTTKTPPSSNRTAAVTPQATTIQSSSSVNVIGPDVVMLFLVVMARFFVVNVLSLDRD